TAFQETIGGHQRGEQWRAGSPARHHRREEFFVGGRGNRLSCLKAYHLLPVYSTESRSRDSDRRRLAWPTEHCEEGPLAESAQHNPQGNASLSRTDVQEGHPTEVVEPLEGIIQPGEDGSALAAHADIDLGDDLGCCDKSDAAAPHRLHFAGAKIAEVMEDTAGLGEHGQLDVRAHVAIRDMEDFDPLLGIDQKSPLVEKPVLAEAAKGIIAAQTAELKERDMWAINPVDESAHRRHQAFVEMRP